MNDLHAIITRHGKDHIANLLGMTERCLGDIQRGKSPLIIDDLYVLEMSYPQFDAIGTIRKIGAIRDKKGWARKARWVAKK